MWLLYPVTTTIFLISASMQFANILSIKRWPRMGSNNLGVPLEAGDSLEPKPAAIITNFNYFISY